MVHSFLAFTRVYIPFVLVFLVLLGGVFVYKQINPDLTTAQHWQRIQDTWEPKQTAALQALSDDSSNFSKVVLDYGALKTQTQGWMNDIGKASDWAPATADVQSLLTDTASYVQTLTQAAAATSNTDLDAVSQSLITDSQTFATEIAKVRLDLGLRAVNAPAPSASASGASPSVAPSGSESAVPSGSASASASASASGAAAPSGSASVAPSASAT